MRCGCVCLLLLLLLQLIPVELCHAFKRKMLNIHPGLLPSFGGKGYYGERVHQAVLASGARCDEQGLLLAQADPAGVACGTFLAAPVQAAAASMCAWQVRQAVRQCPQNCRVTSTPQMLTGGAGLLLGAHIYLQVLRPHGTLCGCRVRHRAHPGAACGAGVPHRHPQAAGGSSAGAGGWCAGRCTVLCCGCSQWLGGGLRVASPPHGLPA